MKQYEYRFSCIVPVYNVELFLEECLESITKQTFSDFEIIIVNDGSTDNSQSICEEFLANNPSYNITLINQKNGGLSAARNSGIERARGQYVLFIDSDDYIAPDSLEQFDKIIGNEEPDIVASYANTVDEFGHVMMKFSYRNVTSSCIEGIEFLNNGYRDNAIVACAPMNAYKLLLIKENNLNFQEGILHEDELWMPLIFKKAKSVKEGKFLFYFHRIRKGSIMHAPTSSMRGSKDIIYICNKLSDEFGTFSKQQIGYFKNHLAQIYMSAVFIGNLYKTDIKIDRFYPLRNALDIHTKIKALIFVLSPRLYCFLDRLYKGNRY